MTSLNDVAAELAAPIEPVKWMPQVTTKKQGGQKVPIMRNGQQVAGCVAYIDARQVMDRLDSVVGPENWSDSYQPSAIGVGVECTLTVLGVSKSDVGMPSDQEPEKGAYSDAFKRAAVKFGIGRRLYDMDMRWLPFDGYRILETPQATQQSAQKKSTQQPTQKQPQPAQNGGGAKPLPQAVRDGDAGVLDRIAAEHPHYRDKAHVWNTLGLLGFEPRWLGEFTAEHREGRAVRFEALTRYGDLREATDGGEPMSQDDALARMAGEPEAE